MHSASGASAAANCRPLRGSLTVPINFAHRYPLATADWHLVPAFGVRGRVVFDTWLHRFFQLMNFRCYAPASAWELNSGSLDSI